MITYTGPLVSVAQMVVRSEDDITISPTKPEILFFTHEIMEETPLQSPVTIFFPTLTIEVAAFFAEQHG